MKYIKEFRDGEKISGIYMVKSKTSATTKNGKNYDNVTLQDKTASIECKVWEPNDPGIDEFDKLDYIDIHGEVTSFNNALQLNIRRARKAREGEYDPADYLPTSSKNIEEMYADLKVLIESIKNPSYKALLQDLFVKDEDFVKKFKFSSAAKSVHHGFVGGLLEHTLSVTKLCDYYSTAYPILKRDLLLTAAMCHDIGKVYEISAFPENDYTDEGNLLGHIVMGSNMVGKRAAKIEGFSKNDLLQLQHCILAHHGKLEFGSPKTPALIEALALSYADDTDAKMETFKEILENNSENSGWLGFQRFLDGNVRATL
ncbi:MAG: HD domain-containing protein [Lachnospiraceae bacterium]|nr:HD domain-containing protein [Lachnospiraceae bacterium]